MGILFKKKEREPIKKVKVKMVCNCGHIECICDCTPTESTRFDTSTIAHGLKSADVCADLNNFFSVKTVV